MMNAAYLVDNVALLSLQEKQDGLVFHCFDMDSKVQIAEGHIGWDVLDKQPFSTLEESASMAALQKIPQLAGLAIAPVAPEMLEQVRGGRKILWQMKKADPELENAKNIRFQPHPFQFAHRRKAFIYRILAAAKLQNCILVGSTVEKCHLLLI